MNEFNVNSVRGRLRSRTLQLPPLTVPARDDTRGIIPISELVKDVDVMIPKSSGLRDGDIIRLFNGEDWFGDELKITQADLDDPEVTQFTLLFPQSDFPAEGTDVTIPLDYGIYDPVAEDGEPTETVVATRFDRRPAGGAQLPPIAFTEAQLGGITEADMINDVLPLLINPYHYGEAEDVIEMWLGSADDETAGTWLPTKFEVSDPRSPKSVEISRAELEAVNDGRRYFAYRVTDWAGNISAISNIVGIDVFIQLPNLAAPRVPQADDGLITYTDANPAVGVEIPSYLGAAEGDVITVSWGASRLTSYSLTASDAISDPLVTIAAPYAIVAGIGDGTVSVLYEMQRVGQPPIDSSPTSVQVNLSTPGGPDPDPNPELPHHGNIRAPLIRSGTSPDNTITPPDYDKDAEATIYRAGVDNKAIWLVGDVLQLHWHNLSDPELAPITVTVPNETSNIPYTVPSATVIDPTGSGEFDVYFTVTRALAGPLGPVKVTVSSPVQRVRVTAGGELPGDGNDLRAATFPDANGSNVITRAVGLAGTKFRIPLDGVSNIELSKNPTVSYSFVGIQTPLNQFTPPPPPHTPIEASRKSAVDVALTQQDLQAGFIDVDLPYTLTYQICRNGAIIDYSLKNDLGSTQALQGYVYFALNVGGGNCPLPSMGNSGSSFNQVTSQSFAVKWVPEIAPPPPIAFTSEQREGIDDADLKEGMLWVRINPYFGGESGDQIELWLGESLTVGNYLTPLYPVNDPAEFTDAAFKYDDLVKLNRRRAFFGYRVNGGDRSTLVGIEIDLSQL